MSVAPLVTIGVPVYNSERHLAQALDSLLAQSYRDFILIVCDNASTDGTAALCEKYVRQDSRVRYFRNPVNIGMSGNFNRVFELTQTKYLKWSTGDDFWAPDMLKDAIAVMESDESIALCYPRAMIVDADGNEKERYDDNLHLMQEDPAERFWQFVENVGLVNHHLGLLRTDAIRKTRLLGRHISADTGFLAELALYGKFFEVKKYQFFRRFHAQSSSWSRRNVEHEARLFYAANVRRTPFNTWRFHATFFSAVSRAPIQFGKKTALFRKLVKKFYWSYGPLLRELRDDVPLVVKRRLGKS